MTDRYVAMLLDLTAERIFDAVDEHSVFVSWSGHEQRWRDAQTYGFVSVYHGREVYMDRDQAVLWQLRRHEFVAEEQ